MKCKVSAQKRVLPLKDVIQMLPFDILKYIKDLHNLIKRQKKRIKALRTKRRTSQKSKTSTVCTVTESTTAEQSPAAVEAAEDRPAIIGPVLPSNEQPAEIGAVAATGTTQNGLTLDSIEDIKLAAENAQQQTNFIYEPTSGLYYDCQTGYYYNAELRLYYDGTNGCYYNYDAARNQFEFHSNVYLVPDESNKNDRTTPNSDNDEPPIDEAACKDTSSGNELDLKNVKGQTRKRKHKSKRSDRERVRSSKSKRSDYREDGEILSSSNSESSGTESPANENSDSSTPIFKGRAKDIAKKFPPSLRVVVLETNLPKIKVGTLFIVTYKGGYLGREGSHDVIIPDINISKCHLKFEYNRKIATYQCTDLGSRNGTILNGKRMSRSKKESKPLDIVHGSTLLISQTKLLCHIHDGYTTCGHCEPGLLTTVEPETDSTVCVESVDHKKQLKRIQKKYGLANEKYIEPAQHKNYNDRAASRRIKVGGFDGSEKTQVASLDASIPTENKGFKMLSKLGWTEGQSLGKNDTGILEPVPLKSNAGTSGLGCDKKSAPIDQKTERKQEKWRKAQHRFNNITSDMFASDKEADT